MRQGNWNCELVLNHASLQSPNREKAVAWLIDIAKGIGQLIEQGVAQNVLRMARSHAEIQCLPEFSFYDAIFGAQQAGAREESWLLLRLTTKTPLIHDLGPEVIDRLRACESRALPAQNGEPLVLCAITDAIAVGFPSDHAWDNDQLSVDFDELLDDGRIVASSDWIDHLARSAHALPICERFRKRAVQRLHTTRNGSEVWESRRTAFPNLLFGPDVEECLQSLNPGHLVTVINRLSALDIAAGEWAKERGATPRWRSKVSNESASVLQDSRLREERRFNSIDGSKELFTWHARYGAGGRIHFRMNGDECSIEVGYIGRHLSL